MNLLHIEWVEVYKFHKFSALPWKNCFFFVCLLVGKGRKKLFLLATNGHINPPTQWHMLCVYIYFINMFTGWISCELLWRKDLLCDFSIERFRVAIKKKYNSSFGAAVSLTWTFIIASASERNKVKCLMTRGWKIYWSFFHPLKCSFSLLTYVKFPVGAFNCKKTTFIHKSESKNHAAGD